MRLFSLTEAEHFCQNYTNEAGDSTRGLAAYVNTHLGGLGLTLVEGTVPFNLYRSCLLRDAERNLFLAASQYRRFLDLTIASSSHWAFVTLYYGGWYAAQALLNMLGGGVFSERYRNRGRTYTRGFVIDVSSGSLGTQELAKRLIGGGSNEETVNAYGSHRQFWEIFYTSMTPFRLLVSAHLSIAITPVNGDPLWQITNRNEVNYKAFEAIRLVESFDTSFVPATFPTSLPGIVNTQFRVLEAMIELSFEFATQLGLNTDSLNYFGNSSLIKHVKQRIYRPKVTGLIKRTRKESIFNR